MGKKKKKSRKKERVREPLGTCIVFGNVFEELEKIVKEGHVARKQHTVLPEMSGGSLVIVILLFFRGGRSWTWQKRINEGTEQVQAYVSV